MLFGTRNSFEVSDIQALGQEARGLDHEFSCIRHVKLADDVLGSFVINRLVCRQFLKDSVDEDIKPALADQEGHIVVVISRPVGGFECHEEQVANRLRALVFHRNLL